MIIIMMMIIIFIIKIIIINLIYIAQFDSNRTFAALYKVITYIQIQLCAHTNMHEAIIFIHMYLSTHKHRHRHVQTYINRHSNKTVHTHITNLHILLHLHIEGFRPEWYISTMIYSCDIPFWSETLDIELKIHLFHIHLC